MAWPGFHRNCRRRTFREFQKRGAVLTASLGVPANPRVGQFRKGDARRASRVAHRRNLKGLNPLLHR
jgi:hypothetical protein